MEINVISPVERAKVEGKSYLRSTQSVPYYLALKAEATAYRFPDRFVWVVNRNNNTVPLMNVARDSKIQECFFAQTISRAPTTATRRGALLP